MELKKSRILTANELHGNTMPVVKRQPQEQPEQLLAQGTAKEAVVTRFTTRSERTVSDEGKASPHGGTPQQNDLRSDDAGLEHLLPDQISVLWTSHQRSSASIGKTREELKGIRVALGSQLFALKSVYAQPGRNGRWSAFLKTIAMPVATANRYVTKHASTLEGPTVNLLNEQIQGPGSVEIAAMVKKLTPKLRKFLVSSSAISKFLELLADDLKMHQSPKP